MRRAQRSAWLVLICAWAHQDARAADPPPTSVCSPGRLSAALQRERQQPAYRSCDVEHLLAGYARHMTALFGTVTLAQDPQLIPERDKFEEFKAEAVRLRESLGRLSETEADLERTELIDDVKRHGQALMQKLNQVAADQILKCHANLDWRKAEELRRRLTECGRQPSTRPNPTPPEPAPPSPVSSSSPARSLAQPTRAVN